jgi:hypothetical protein
MVIELNFKEGLLNVKIVISKKLDSPLLVQLVGAGWGWGGGPPRASGRPCIKMLLGIKNFNFQFREVYFMPNTQYPNIPEAITFRGVQGPRSLFTLEWRKGASLK